MVSTDTARELYDWAVDYGALVEHASAVLDSGVRQLERTVGTADETDALLAAAVLGARAGGWLCAAPIPNEVADALFRTACIRCQSAGTLVLRAGSDREHGGRELASRVFRLLRAAASGAALAIWVIDRGLGEGSHFGAHTLDLDG